MKKIGLVIILCSMTMTMLSACSGEEEILIGVQVPLSGKEAKVGKGMENATQLAVNEINEQGGINDKKIKLSIKDDACNKETGTTIAREFISEKVLLVVGGYCSDSTTSGAYVYHANSIPMVVTATNSDNLAEVGFNDTFLLDGTALQQAKVTMDYILNKKQSKKLAIVYEDGAASKNLAEITKETIQENGGKVVVFSKVEGEATDFKEVITNVKQAVPDMTYFVGYPKTSGLFAVQFKQQIGSTLLFSNGANDKIFIETAGKNAEGTLVTMTTPIQQLPKPSVFIQNYKKQYKENPDEFATRQYYGVKIVADALKRANSTGIRKITESLQQTELEKLTEQVSFTFGNISSAPQFKVFQVSNGEFVLVK